MNSNVQVLIKLEYVYATCSELIKREECTTMLPTLMWMQQETATVYNRIMYTAEPSKRLSWLRSVERSAQHIQTLRDDKRLAGYKDVTVHEGVLFLMSTITQLLEDISQVPSKKVLVGNILTAAYTLEDLVKLPKDVTYEEDDIRCHASILLNGIYDKLAEMH